MAQMYPNRIGEHVTSSAERQLYEALRAGLGDGYLVFHGVNWQSLDRAGRPRDGEADFVIAHPRRGIIVLEVKGGRIRFDARRGRYQSVDRRGRTHRIKDPFYQVRDSKHKLLDTLIKMTGGRDYINIVDAVAFPDVDVFGDLPGLDKPREIVLDRNDVENISAWVGRCFAYGLPDDGRGRPGSSAEAVAVLADLLGTSWELRPVLWGDFQLEARKLIELTEQQYLLLDMLNRHRRVVVRGGAGTGKTLVAAEKLVRLARQKFRVLFTCFNKSLAAYMRERLDGHDNLQISHFHELCYELTGEAGNRPPIPPENHERYWAETLPEALLEATDLLPDTRFDAIIVDEAQDFYEDWWVPLQTLLHDPDGGILYIFFDDNQRIYEHDDYAFPIKGEPYSLSINCRNTREIYDQVVRFCQGTNIMKPNEQGPLGRPPQVEAVPAGRSLQEALQPVLKRLIEDEHVPTQEIAVLSPIRKRSELWQEPPPGATWHLTGTWPAPEDEIYATTIHDFKGLESAVVILVELEHYWGDEQQLEELLYVGCSRARHHLVVMLPEEAPAHLRNLFAD